MSQADAEERLLTSQLPHVLAISWRYREDYGRAGYPLLPEGAVARQAVLQSLMLLMAGVVEEIKGMDSTLCVSRFL